MSPSGAPAKTPDQQRRHRRRQHHQRPAAVGSIVIVCGPCGVATMNCRGRRELNRDRQVAGEQRKGDHGRRPR